MWMTTTAAKAPERYLPSGQSPMQRHGDFPSAYFDTVDPRLPLGGEHFAGDRGGLLPDCRG